MSIITLTTDFGAGSPYVAAMKGVILTINPAVTLVDLTHAVPAQDIRHAAVVLEEVADRFPAGTIHVVVVDPGVGTDREIVYVRVGRQQFVAPDNGLLSRVIARMPPSKIIRLAEPRFWLADVSTTFHGRDIMAPVAARLSLGLEPEQLGPSLERLIVVEWPRARLLDRKIAGHVIEIDSFGNLITNIAAEPVRRPADRQPRLHRVQHLRDLGRLRDLRRAVAGHAGGAGRLQRPARVGHRRRQRGRSGSA